MPHDRQMIETNPSTPAVDVEALVECMETCSRCESACNNLQRTIEC